MNGKRFLFVLCGFELGGAERQALHFARYLKNLGCDVRVWGHHHHYRGPERVIDECNAAAIPWAVYRFRWPCRRTALVRDAWRMLRGLHRERPDIILPYLPWPSVSCGIVWRLSPAKVCIWGQRNSGDLHGDAIEKFAYHRSSAVVCNAEHEVVYLRQTLGETRAPIYVVHNGINLAPGQKTRAKWRAELGIHKDAIVATMVANFRPQKDHPSLLHAWKRILQTKPDKEAQPHLLLAGAPQESYSAVYQLANSLGLLDSVSFLGQVKDVAGLLTASDIGILTTTHEGLPNAVLEYMASGLPVVATDLPGNREALGDESQQPFCKPGDPDSLASRLQSLLNDHNLRKKLGSSNRHRALEKFSIDEMCEKMVRIVTALLVSGPSDNGTVTTLIQS